MWSKKIKWYTSLFIDKLILCIWNLGFINHESYGIVLMFHHVTDEHLDINESCQCSKSRFAEIIDSFQREGYIFIDPYTLEFNINNGVKGKYAVVTFDDVPSSFMINAYPLLKAKQIPFTLFITTSFTFKTEYLSKQDILNLDKDCLCTIGAHTISHPKLRYSRNSFFEVRNSKIDLETLLRHKVDFFAYPYGKTNAVSLRNLKDAKRAGFKLAFGTIPARLNNFSAKYRFFLPRMASF